MIAARQIFLGRGGGIMRINSVKSDGVAYTACAHVFQDTTTLRLRVVLSCESDIMVSDINEKNCFGGSLNDTQFLLNNYNHGYPTVKDVEFQVYSGGGIVERFKKWRTFSDGNFHEIILEKNGSYFSVYFDGHGETLSKYVSGTPAHGRVCVFTQNAAIGNNVVPMSNRVPKKVSISAFQMWEGGDLVSDLIPAIAPDGEICFYDAVAGEYARNLAGSGSFSEGA